MEVKKVAAAGEAVEDHNFSCSNRDFLGIFFEPWGSLPRMMQKIRIDEAREGMKLAKSVTSEQGTVLCREGTELTEAIIETLKKRGIRKLKVEGHPVERPGEPSPEELIRGIRHRFSRAAGDPVAVKLRDAMIRYIMRENEESDDDREDQAGD